jgi:hypothetical protein
MLIFLLGLSQLVGASKVISLGDGTHTQSTYAFIHMYGIDFTQASAFCLASAALLLSDICSLPLALLHLLLRVIRLFAV